MKKNNKGFTLAELLIVVAIIAVLVAIAIPIFTTQLEKSREMTDIANLRSAYAAGTVYAMTTTDSTLKGNYDPGQDGAVVSSAAAKLGQGTATIGKADVSVIAGYSSYKNSTDAKGKGITITYSKGVVKGVNFS